MIYRCSFHVNKTSLNYTGQILNKFELEKGDLLFSLSPINNLNKNKNFYLPLIPKLFVLNNNFTINLISFHKRIECQDDISRILNRKLSAFKFTIIFIGELPKYLYELSNPIAYANLDSFFVFIHLKNILEWYQFANSDMYRKHWSSYFNYKIVFILFVIVIIIQ